MIESRRGNQVKLKIKLSLIIVLLLAAFILLLAQDNDHNGDIYAISNRGDILDFKSMAIESSKTFLPDEYNNKMMPSRPPGEVEAFEALLPNAIIGDVEKPAKSITQPNTHALP